MPLETVFCLSACLSCFLEITPGAAALYNLCCKWIAVKGQRYGYADLKYGMTLFRKIALSVCGAFKIKIAALYRRGPVGQLF